MMAVEQSCLRLWRWNNIWFAAREGYDVTGIDASKAAILFAKKRFDADGLKCNLKIGDFSALPFDDN